MTDDRSGSRANRPKSANTRHRSTPPHRPDSAPTRADATSGGAPEVAVPTTPAAVIATGLTKAYGDAIALSPLDLRIEFGDRVSLIGHNGSGKTTLLRMLVGVLEPSGGTATVAGHPAGSLAARASIAYLADQPVFYDDLTVWEHLEYIARMHGTEDWEQHAVDLVEMVGLTARIDDLPMTFSRGLKQKAAITMAFVRPFDVMLIDEPFVGLDRVGREALLELIALAHGDGATMVVATHELASVRSSSRLIALADGESIYDGDPADADLDLLTEGSRTTSE
jgi:ABC-2 type transport system ATP-binding protein